jgi:Holliday junction resolvase
MRRELVGKHSRDKGARGEREAAAEIRSLFGVEACRGAQHRGSPDTPDVCTAIEGVHFEVKRRETFRLWDAIAQAVVDAGPNIPVVLHRSNSKPWIAVVRLDDLPRLATQLYLTSAANA